MGSCGGMAVTRGLPCILLMLACCWLCEAGAGLAALYVLGDSQADAGTNNHLATVLRADHPHNGVDYLECKATGRFSNGKNFVDFLAEHLKLPSSPPPYLSICNTPSNNSIYLSGVNFASGGAGVLNQTNQGECIIFDYQIDHHFSKVHASLVQQLGQAQASAHLSRSIFAVAIGGNDILNYVRPSLVNQVLSPCPPPTQSRDEFVDSLVLSLKDQLQRLYKLGMRRMFIIGAPPLGCCPVLRGKEECDAGANYMSSQYNIKVASLLRDMSYKYPDMLYSLFDPSIKLLDYFQRPGANGYAVVDTACCGLGGEKNAMFSCTLASSLCKNRTNHVFWDFVHPTEITAQKLTKVAFHGLAPSVTPINVRQLRDTAM